MTSQTPGRGVTGPETPLEGHPNPVQLDLDAIRDKWLRLCPWCDAGMPDDCTHPDEDYRPVLLDLVREVERLRSPALWAQRLFDQRDAALEAVARVRKLHARSSPPYRDHCTGCLGAWPCETIQALEMDREFAVRTLACPVCGAGPGARCRWPSGSFKAAAHTGRYNAAVKAGLVPAMVGSHG